MGFFDLRNRKPKAPTSFDPSLIARLLDRTNRAGDRGMAAEALTGNPMKEVTDALLAVILDETDDFGVRDEAAGSLAWTYRCFGVDEEALTKIPERLRMEMKLK